MPLIPLAEDVLALLDKPDITPTQRMILKLAAALIVQSGVRHKRFVGLEDPRLTLTREEIDMLPGTLEVWNGKPIPKDWPTPERLAAVARENEQIEAEMVKGLSYGEAVAVVAQRDEQEG
jgi:hypothetical protein